MAIQRYGVECLILCLVAQSSMYRGLIQINAEPHPFSNGSTTRPMPQGTRTRFRPHPLSTTPPFDYTPFQLHPLSTTPFRPRTHLSTTPPFDYTPFASPGAFSMATPGRPGSVLVSLVYPHAATALPPIYEKSHSFTVALRLYPLTMTACARIRTTSITRHPELYTTPRRKKRLAQMRAG